MSEQKTIELDANGIHFHALTQGSGPLALCLHGFPDDATTWQHQAPALAAAGYRVVAPYLRGYAPTAPSPQGYYQTAALGRDVIALLDALSPGEPAVVIGHDWGALASYAAAVLAPERIRRLVTLAVPYGPRLATAFTTNYEQQKRSWYVFFFQTMMAESSVESDGLRFIRNIWHDWSPDWGYTEADIAPVLETLGKPGVVEAAIAYYRCLFDPARLDPALMADQMRIGFEPITVPTLYIHGFSDACMAADLSDGMEEVFPAGLEKVFVEGTGHFVHRENPDHVTAEILSFIQK